MPDRGQIDAYYNDVVQDAKDVFGVPVAFRAILRENWYKIRTGGEIPFDLVPLDPLRSETAVTARRRDKTRHRVYVFPLCDVSSACIGTFWVSWHETWQKRTGNSGAFVLLSAGWTLFEGLCGSENKTQVVRVDWDQLPYRGQARAGHPHWHFDHELFLTPECAEEEVRPGLVQVMPTPIGSVGKRTSIGFIHLAMGAWKEGMGHPECWQRDYGGDCAQLRDWCIKTLVYLKEQIAGG